MPARCLSSSGRHGITSRHPSVLLVTIRSPHPYPVVEDKAVTRLEYEAYEEMALKEMDKLCGTARKQHPAPVWSAALLVNAVLLETFVTTELLHVESFEWVARSALLELCVRGKRTRREA